MFNVCIASYAREALCNRVIQAVIDYVPNLRFISICDQSGYSSFIADSRLVIVSATPTKAAGIARDRAARAILPRIPSSDVLLFIDDDVEIAPEFSCGVAGLLDLLAMEQTGVVQLAHMPTQKTRRTILGYSSGGMVCLARRYEEIGGYGADYLDDVEFFLRSHLAGFLNWQYAGICNKHHFRSPGGLRAAHGVKSKAMLHQTLSRLDERYPEAIRRNSKTFLGFSLIPERRRTHG